MANTFIHKAKGKFNNGINQCAIPIYLQGYYHRHNSDKGYFRKLRLRLIEKQADKDMNVELSNEM